MRDVDDDDGYDDDEKSCIAKGSTLKPAATTTKELREHKLCKPQTIFLFHFFACMSEFPMLLTSAQNQHKMRVITKCH